MGKIIFAIAVITFIIGAIFTYHNAHSSKILQAQNKVTYTNNNPDTVRDEYIEY